MAKAVFRLNKPSQWQGFVFCNKQNRSVSCKVGGDSSSFSSSKELRVFLCKWFFKEVIVPCNFGATLCAWIEQREKYFLPKPLSNFTVNLWLNKAEV